MKQPLSLLMLTVQLSTKQDRVKAKAEANFSEHPRCFKQLYEKFLFGDLRQYATTTATTAATTTATTSTFVLVGFQNNPEHA